MRTLYAVIIADPNSDAFGEIVSEHHTPLGAGAAYMDLENRRWAYVARRRPDGSYPHRVEALDLPDHHAAIEAALAAGRN